MHEKGKMLVSRKKILKSLFKKNKVRDIFFSIFNIHYKPKQKTDNDFVIDCNIIEQIMWWQLFNTYS